MTCLGRLRELDLNLRLGTEQALMTSTQEDGRERRDSRGCPWAAMWVHQEWKHLEGREGLHLDRDESLRRSVWGSLLETLVKVAIWH